MSRFQYELRVLVVINVVFNFKELAIKIEDSIKCLGNTM